MNIVVAEATIAVLNMRTQGLLPLLACGCKRRCGLADIRSSAARRRTWFHGRLIPASGHLRVVGDSVLPMPVRRRRSPQHAANPDAVDFSINKIGRFFLMFIGVIAPSISKDQSSGCRFRNLRAALRAAFQATRIIK